MFTFASRYLPKKLFSQFNKELVPRLTYYKTIFRCSTFRAIDKIKLQSYFEKLEKEYRSLTEQNDLISETRLEELSPVLNMLERRRSFLQYLKNLDGLMQEDGEELRRLAEEEKVVYEDKVSDVEKELLEVIVPEDTEDSCEAIVLEVNAGVGGQEAMLFARELVDMYLAFIGYKGWSYELAAFDTSDIGGLRHASVLVQGAQVFRYFKYEAGVHRVQRVPATERTGRIHTSTVSVVALPQPEALEVTLHEKDLRVDTKRASGAGGQHVNTTDSAVRIVHLPTGITVECQVDRSQIKNREIALQRLKAKLYEEKLNAQLADSEAARKSQVRSNFRNEKIRTYNFSQDRITDHRLHSSNLYNLKGFLSGGQQLEVLINNLHSKARLEKLTEILNSYN